LRAAEGLLQETRSVLVGLLKVAAGAKHRVLPEPLNVFGQFRPLIPGITMSVMTRSTAVSGRERMSSAVCPLLAVSTLYPYADSTVLPIVSSNSRHRP